MTEKEEFLNEYQKYLFYMGFNFEQIEFIIKQRSYYDLINWSVSNTRKFITEL